MLALITFDFCRTCRFTRHLFQSERQNESVDIVINENPECCGAHEVCERDNLQIIDTKIEYSTMKN